MIRKIVMTLLSFSSLSAHAGEVWFKASGRLFRADIPVSQESVPELTRDELIDLLKDAQIKEVKPSASSRPNWTENSPVASSSPGIWTEKSPVANTWTDSKGGGPR